MTWSHLFEEPELVDYSNLRKGLCCQASTMYALANSGREAKPKKSMDTRNDEDCVCLPPFYPCTGVRNRTWLAVSIRRGHGDISRQKHESRTSVTAYFTATRMSRGLKVVYRWTLNSGCPEGSSETLYRSSMHTAAWEWRGVDLAVWLSNAAV